MPFQQHHSACGAYLGYAASVVCTGDNHRIRELTRRGLQPHGLESILAEMLQYAIDLDLDIHFKAFKATTRVPALYPSTAANARASLS